ncbi:universal stress protein [Halorussus litoreus]|uniref:universal stress protein n=1 Tax=Halorussus litoreus TaxID=1710536 RepID=UPI000E2444FD|nr:universal stress protein [Halorussus litoreus]
MTILVPFDGSELSESALVRATALGDVFGEQVLALSVVPTGNATYARERDWLGPEEEYDDGRVVGQLHEQMTGVSPSADFRHEFVDRYASTGTIARRLREMAKEVGASLVVIGSDNAGSMVASIRSVGSTVAAADAFDVLIVRQSATVEESRAKSGW